MAKTCRVRPRGRDDVEGRARQARPSLITPYRSGVVGSTAKATRVTNGRWSHGACVPA